jgi:CheY-like chemotaxis protein
MDPDLSGPRRVLIIDDDPHGREGLRALLVAEGYGVETAADGLAAIRKMKDGGFDVAIVDLNLPELLGLTLSGWDLVRIQRAFDPGVSVIVMSADLGPDAAARAEELEVEQCLEKPIDPVHLKAWLRTLRPGRRIRRQVDPRATRRAG